MKSQQSILLILIVGDEVMKTNMCLADVWTINMAIKTTGSSKKMTKYTQEDYVMITDRIGYLQYHLLIFMTGKYLNLNYDDTCTLTAKIST